MLVPSGDENAFAQELRRLVSRPEALASMRRAAHAFAAQLHAKLRDTPSLDVGARSMDALLRRAMQRTAAARTSTVADVAATDATAATANGAAHSYCWSMASPLSRHLALLFLLYSLQGAVFGFVGGALPVLVSGATFSSLGVLSVTLWPFALKALLAPLVDSLWLHRLGRRKSWVVPCTLASGLLLALFTSQVT